MPANFFGGLVSAILSSWGNGCQQFAPRLMGCWFIGLTRLNRRDKSLATDWLTFYAECDALEQKFLRVVKELGYDVAAEGLGCSPFYWELLGEEVFLGTRIGQCLGALIHAGARYVPPHFGVQDTFSIMVGGAIGAGLSSGSPEKSEVVALCLAAKLSRGPPSRAAACPTVGDASPA